MFRPNPVVLVLLVLATNSAASASAPQKRHGPSPLKVLDQWLALYQRGAIDLSGEKRQMRGRTMECVSLIGKAVGKEMFMPDALEVMQAIRVAQVPYTAIILYIY